MTRDEIGTLLPFLANDTLTGEERRAVEQAVADDPDLQSELAALRAIRTTMQAEEHFSPGEMGLARLMRDVDSEAPKAAAPKSSPRLWVWQSIAAVLLVAVVGQTAFQMRGQEPMAEMSEPAGYSLAGADSAGDFTIAVNPDTTEDAFRNLLLQAGVEIVSGPSALGFYQLAAVEGVTTEQARAILEASDIVESLSDNTE